MKKMTTVTRDYKLLEKTNNCELVHVVEWEIDNLKTREKRISRVYYIISPAEYENYITISDAKTAYEIYNTFA